MIVTSIRIGQSKTGQGAAFFFIHENLRSDMVLYYKSANIDKW